MYLEYIVDQPFAHVCIKFQFVSLTEKSDKKFNVLEFERKKIEEIKEQMSTSSLIQVHMIHQPTVYHVSTLCASQALRKR